jgi:hypothetical protein
LQVWYPILVPWYGLASTPRAVPPAQLGKDRDFALGQSGGKEAAPSNANRTAARAVLWFFMRSWRMETKIVEIPYSRKHHGSFA